MWLFKQGCFMGYSWTTIIINQTTPQISRLNLAALFLYHSNQMQFKNTIALPLTPHQPSLHTHIARHINNHFKTQITIL